MNNDILQSIRQQYQEDSSVLLKLCKFFQHELSINQDALSYCIDKRKLLPETLERFFIGYCSTIERMKKFVDMNSIDLDLFGFHRFENRIIFPTQDAFGNMIGFTGRQWPEYDKEKGKYVNSGSSDIYQKSLVLYGLYQALEHIRKYGFVLLVEGNVDVLSCYQSGLRNVVCPGSTNFTEEQAFLLSIYTDKLVCCFDNDAAGIEATSKVQKTCNIAGLEFIPLRVSEAKDIDEFIAKYGVHPVKDTLSSLGLLRNIL